LLGAGDSVQSRTRAKLSQKSKPKPQKKEMADQIFSVAFFYQPFYVFKRAQAILRCQTHPGEQRCQTRPGEQRWQTRPGEQRWQTRPGEQRLCLLCVIQSKIEQRALQYKHLQKSLSFTLKFIFKTDCS
jgi:hypothetical protein